MRSRIESWANWAFENWRFLFIPPFVVVMIGLSLCCEYTADPDLNDRIRRSKIFWQLQDEMNGLETPTSSEINSTDAHHKSGSILITTRYRTDAKPPEFFGEMDRNLARRGWIRYEGEQDRSAVRSFHYCRDRQDANLYLERKGVFDSTPGDYWKLHFSVGSRSGRVADRCSTH